MLNHRPAEAGVVEAVAASLKIHFPRRLSSSSFLAATHSQPGSYYRFRPTQEIHLSSALDALVPTIFS